MSCVASLILPAETALLADNENDSDVPVPAEASQTGQTDGVCQFTQTIVAAAAFTC
jgi:hypothetical protein